MAQEFEVVFTAQFRTKVTIKEGESLSDALSGIDIPENGTCEYKNESFEIDSVKDGDGNEVDVDELDGTEEAE